MVGTDGTWKQHQAEWLPAPQRNTDAGDFVEIIDGRLEPDRMGGAGLRRQQLGRRLRCSDQSEPLLSPSLYAQRTRITELPIAPSSVTTLEGGAVVIDFGKIYAGAARSSSSATESQDARSRCTSDTCSIPTVTSLPPTTPRQTNLAFYYTERDGRRHSSPTPILGFRYLEIDEPGEPIGRDQVTAWRVIARCPTFLSHLHLVGPRASTRYGISAPAPLSTRPTSNSWTLRPVRRASSCGTRATSPRWSCGSIRDQNLSNQALRDFARSQKRFWPDGRVSDIYPTGYGAQSYVNFTALYPEWVWRYYASTGDLAEITNLYPTLVRLSDYLWRGVHPHTGLVTAYPLAPSADNNYGYDFNTAADTSINILVGERVPRISLDRGVASATRRAQRTRSQDRRVSQRPSTDGSWRRRALRGRTCAPTAPGRPTPHKQANIQALAYGLVPAERQATVGSTWRVSAYRWSPTREWNYCGRCTLQGSTQTS